MLIDLTSAEIILTEEQPHYEFVIDTDLVHVGGGSGLVNY